VEEKSGMTCELVITCIVRGQAERTMVSEGTTAGIARGSREKAAVYFTTVGSASTLVEGVMEGVLVRPRIAPRKWRHQKCCNREECNHG